MSKLYSFLTKLYDRTILEKPGFVIICLLIMISFLGYQAKNFKLDASAETLVLDSDKDLRYSRVINARYGEHDFLVLTFKPAEDLFSDKVLLNLAQLRDDLNKLDFVTSVTTILDVPLLESPPVPIKELTSNIRTLESPDVDKELAKKEFRNSPIYNNLIISPDLKTTALQINLPNDDHYTELLSKRNHFREKLRETGKLTADEESAYRNVSAEFKQYRDKIRSERHENIAMVRQLMDNYRGDAELFLGGISMIADDLITFIKSYLKIFGFRVLFFLIITLGIIFKQVRWVILPLFCCAFSVVCMVGFLGTFGWEVTVISSNFISLQIIITMAITIHLVVRYRELLKNNPDKPQRELVLDTVRFMTRPCIYAALTTIAGFGSLLTSDILPVKTFGWMMISGISVSLVLTFIFFPAGLLLISKGKPNTGKESRFTLTQILARFTEFHGNLIMVVSIVILILSGIGISRLLVENSFIDYFKHTTEIYQGMKVIDQNLGGTTPLDVIFEFDPEETTSPIITSGKDSEDDMGDDEFDEFDEFDSKENEEKYWFTSDKMEQIKKIHTYLDRIPETGKVLSLGTMLQIAEKLNDNKPLDNFKLSLVYTKLPDKFKNIVMNPYVSVENNQVRFSIRVRDSEKTLKRNELLKKIHRELTGKLGLKKENVHVTGMLVLYNNMLQSLFSSQILTLGIVVVALLFMFTVLFRSLKIALIAIFPNLLATGVVLGFMGWMNIPLDMMTITIAAISVGIAVDDTIHYIHRFIEEFKNDGDYIKAMHRCHGSIGHAMYYTSLTIIIGFSILALSSFIPSIYFGLLTGLAMFIALIAALTLLPQLIIYFKPLGPNSDTNI